MQFSEAWLRTFTNPPLDTAGLCDKLTMAGLEVETAGPAAPPFSGVVVGRIEAVAPHPDADRLRLCTVDVGAAERLSIVCGAPNAAAGMTVPCALVGAKLPGGLEIRRARVRGVESAGMLCSAKELGLSDDAAGLLPLDGSLAPGADLRAALALDDALITLKITPNRADCLSLLGIGARRRRRHRRAAGGAGAARGAGDRDGAPRGAGRRPHRLPALRQPPDRGHRRDGADTGVDEGPARAQRASARSRPSSTSPIT